MYAIPHFPQTKWESASTGPGSSHCRKGSFEPEAWNIVLLSLCRHQVLESLDTRGKKDSQSADTERNTTHCNAHHVCKIIMSARYKKKKKTEQGLQSLFCQDLVVSKGLKLTFKKQKGFLDSLILLPISSWTIRLLNLQTKCYLISLGKLYSLFKEISVNEFTKQRNHM